jgi:HAD superfamily hydrolase (TIGR01490 family)
MNTPPLHAPRHFDATGLALFDLDNTLLPIDSDTTWAKYLIHIGVQDRANFERENDRFYAQYKAGTLDTHEFLAFVFKPLLGRPISDLEAWRADYFENFIQPHINAPALALVKKHQDAGHLCAIVTATNSWITVPIAKAFGVETLIGTDLEVENGCFTGRAQGLPSFREGKITRTEQWLASFGRNLGSFDDSWFYSDSSNDRPLMDLVSRPVAVHPDAKLLAHAQANQWPVLMLHSEAPQ